MQCNHGVTRRITAGAAALMLACALGAPETSKAASEFDLDALERMVAPNARIGGALKKCAPAEYDYLTSCVRLLSKHWGSLTGDPTYEYTAEVHDRLENVWRLNAVQGAKALAAGAATCGQVEKAYTELPIWRYCGKNDPEDGLAVGQPSGQEK